jgi:hypothetical protein
MLLEFAEAAYLNFTEVLCNDCFLVTPENLYFQALSSGTIE